MRVCSNKISGSYCAKEAVAANRSKGETWCQRCYAANLPSLVIDPNVQLFAPATEERQ